MSTLLEQYRVAMTQFDDRLQKIADDQWRLPTPCSEWDLRALVAHVVDEQRWAPYLLDGGSVAEAGDRFAGDSLGSDPKGAWNEASRAARAAFNSPNALDRHVSVSWGHLSARDYLWQMTVDLAVHAWDVARAIGCDDRLHPELVRRICSDAEKNLEEMAASGAFARPVTVPAGADLQARMLALFGRRS